MPKKREMKAEQEDHHQAVAYQEEDHHQVTQAAQAVQEDQVDQEDLHQEEDLHQAIHNIEDHHQVDQEAVLHRDIQHIEAHHLADQEAHQEVHQDLILSVENDEIWNNNNDINKYYFRIFIIMS